MTLPDFVGSSRMCIREAYGFARLGKALAVGRSGRPAHRPVTAASYNKAARSLKNVKTDILCKPWYVGNALPYHIPNNTDITVDYKDGKVVVKEKCFNIAPVDKELVQTRVWEKKYKLNG